MTDADVSTLSPAVQRQQERARLGRTLLGGTPAMRAAGEAYLPREPAESTAAYAVRLRRSFLFNAYRRSVEMLTGKVLHKGVALGDDVPEPLRALAEDADGAGRHLNILARDVFGAALVDGLTAIVADFPQVPEGMTLADERALRVRPYLAHVPLARVIGFRATTVDGRDALEHLRYVETVTEPDGRFGEREVEQIRVIEPDRWEVWRRNGDGIWMIHAAGPMRGPRGKPLAAVPAAVIYAGARLGALEAEPPLDDLAHLNLQHWQSSSDQNHVLHVARVPLLFGTGFGEQADDILGNIVTIGPNHLITGPAESDLKFVEHSGAAIEAGRQDLLDIEARMDVIGFELMTRRSGSITATAEAIGEARADSALGAMALELEDGLERAFQFAAQWIGLGPDAGGSLAVSKDFGLALRDRAELDLLLKARAAREISRTTFLAEIKRRGLLPDDFDTNAEAERVAGEMPVAAGRGGAIDSREA